MRIAVASTDGVSMSPHFGRSRCFVVFTAEDGKITGQEVRDNTYTAHAQGQSSGPFESIEIGEATHDVDGRLVLMGFRKSALDQGGQAGPGRGPALAAAARSRAPDPLDVG